MVGIGVQKDIAAGMPKTQMIAFAILAVITTISWAVFTALKIHEAVKYNQHVAQATK